MEGVGAAEGIAGSAERDVPTTSNVPGGGVWVPGGLHRLQSGWDGRSPSGGFDSRPPPPIESWPRGLSQSEIGPVVMDW